MIARFVTATGTGIGKTLLTAALAHRLHRAGRRVRVLKPIVTGLTEGPLSASDPAILLSSVDQPLTHRTLDATSPFRFATPLAPAMAAAREGSVLNVEAVTAFCRAAAADAPDVLLIEGVGGVMVPLAGRVTVADWMAALGHPAILVAGSYLGTLSHTLTALALLRARAIPCAGIVVSETPGSPVGLEETVDALQPFASGEPVIALPRIEGPQPWRHAPDLGALLA